MHAQVDPFNFYIPFFASSHPDDIEAWTGMSSEKRLAGGVFGPTAACITAIQFSYFKQGDRFYYENDLIGTKFSESTYNFCG